GAPGHRRRVEPVEGTARLFAARPGPPHGPTQPRPRCWYGRRGSRTAEELARQGLECECLGGGRLDHRPQERKIHVYGYSVGFGRADHSVTTEKLKAEYPDYKITWADEGY
uniref:14 kDa phosphohistidine phosphatase n=1 Tax=Amazona collaria TaxID=241587 RepID=A0A8B9G0M1_9PSIT